MCWILRESGIRLAKEGDKRSDMGKGGGPNPEQKGGAPFLSVPHLGLDPCFCSSTFVM